ncbi:Tenascin-X [Holothuria leucospilota]|uniref:Tenascin-X n=1 Tax=Holothuria leucospilota TaxID=206669 RepID=A0A9Q1BSX4_HOLLE|nr:Tenascin-X [Holothuria leucospilota]
MFVESEEEKYRLHWDGYSGNASSNGLETHNLMEFSTKDNDNDNNALDSCAITYRGAWWFNNCYYSDLNGEYGSTYIWMPFLLESSEMKVRPRGRKE